MDYVNLPVFNPNVFSEDEDDLPGVFLGDRDGDRVVSNGELQHVSPCLLPQVWKTYNFLGGCSERSYCHWFGEEGSYQSKDDEGDHDTSCPQSILPSSFIFTVVLSHVPS